MTTEIGTAIFPHRGVRCTTADAGRRDPRLRLVQQVDEVLRVRIFYASDVHGSEVCWRKFLNAARFYRADVLVMGGDLVGKAVVPIALSAGGEARAQWAGSTHDLLDERAISELETSIRNAGFYPARVPAEELAAIEEDEQALVRLFEHTVRREFARWLAIADEKLSSGIPAYVIAGNDDPWFIDELLAGSRQLIPCDGRRVELEGHEMISLSYANPTPWQSPRELEEDELLIRIRVLADQLAAPERAIFNLHVPPYATGLDTAPLLDDGFRPVSHLGQVESGPVGSTAVRQAIVDYQPLLGLHGHIHESRAIGTLGRTVIINPGSEYSSGRIHGALVETKNGSLKRRQLVVG